MLWDLILFQCPFTGNSETWFATRYLRASEMKSVLRDAFARREIAASDSSCTAGSQALGKSCYIQTLPLLQITVISGSLKIIQDPHIIPCAISDTFAVLGQWQSWHRRFPLQPYTMKGLRPSLSRLTSESRGPSTLSTFDRATGSLQPAKSVYISRKVTLAQGVFCE